MKELTFIFDYDGTLCDTLDAISDSLARTFRNFTGKVPDTDEIKALIGTGKTLEGTIHGLHRAGTDLDEPTLKEWVTFYRRDYNLHAESKVTLFEGVADSLGKIGRVGNMILLSNKGIHAVEASLRHFGIRDHFNLVLAEEPGQPRKPHPDVFSRRIVPALPGVEASGCVVVGDTAADLEFARNIGAAACFARYGYGDLPSCEAIGFTHDLDRISDLIGIFGADCALAGHNSHATA
jgi:phosphoglycolate phosphatase